MRYRLKNNIRALGKNSDNMMFNEYILEFPEKFSPMGNEWNYMPFLANTLKIDEPNFFHFVGIPGKKFLLALQNKYNNIEKALENIIKK